MVTSAKVSAGQNGNLLEDPALERTRLGPRHPFPPPLRAAAWFEQRHEMNEGSGGKRLLTMPLTAGSLEGDLRGTPSCQPEKHSSLFRTASPAPESKSEGWRLDRVLLLQGSPREQVTGLSAPKEEIFSLDRGQNK